MINISAKLHLVVRGPTMNTALEVWPHQCRVQGHDHLPTPAGHSIPDTSQDAVGLLGHLGTLLAHVQPAADQHPEILFRQETFQPLLPEPVALHGVVVTKVQDPALGLVESQAVGLGPLIQSVQIPLQSLPTLKQIDASTQLGVIGNLLREHSIPSSRSLIKMLNKSRPKTEPWGHHL